MDMCFDTKEAGAYDLSGSSPFTLRAQLIQAPFAEIADLSLSTGTLRVFIRAQAYPDFNTAFRRTCRAVRTVFPKAVLLQKVKP